MRKILLLLGVLLLVTGLLWPWLGQVGLGRLPGDIVVGRPGLRVYLPFTTMLVLSIVVSLIAWILNR